MRVPIQAAPAARRPDSSEQHGSLLVSAQQQKCWGAKKCSGKVLSNRDHHNCCNYGGKSWSDAAGNCYPC
jgi:hypothetical protein